MPAGITIWEVAQMADLRSAVVVGGGIGGLCTAIVLPQTGWSVTVLERHKVASDAGSGISLWPNAMRVLDRFGLAEQVRAVAAPLSAEGGLRTPSGAWLTRAKAGTAPLVEVVLLHRADLQSILLAALPDGCVRTGVAAEDLLWPTADAADASGQLANGRPTVRARDSTGPVEFAADLVVAADGVHSTLRTAFWPQSLPPSYTGYTTWRGVTPSGAIHASGGGCGGETWGRGAKFGYLPLTDERIYWFAEINAAAGLRSDDERAASLHHSRQKRGGTA